MTDTEKKVMVRLYTKILTETELYEMDMEVRYLVDWICVSEQMKENINKIRSLTGGIQTDRARMSGGHQRKARTYEKVV
mgnify:CR=1 FL=1